MKHRLSTHWIRWTLLAGVACCFIFILISVKAKQDFDLKVPPFVTNNPVPSEDLTRANIILPSSKYGLSVEQRTPVYKLGTLDLQAIDTSDPTMIGISRPVNIALETHGTLLVNSDGSKIRLLGITSPGAKSIQIHLKNMDIPMGDEVYVYGMSSNSHVAGPYIRKGLIGDGEVWADTIEGDTAILEYYMKGDERRIDIFNVSHSYQLTEKLTVPETLDCHLNAACSTKPEKDAVGRITYTSTDGVKRVCTGTMLNDRPSDRAPLFLTANHCVPTSAVASSVEVFWFYRTNCVTGDLNWARSTPSGAMLLATSSASDFSLLKILGGIPPAVIFAGWDSGPQTLYEGVYGLHHPGGSTPLTENATDSILRISNGQLASFDQSCIDTGLSGGYRIDWLAGTTERGSSGSALFHTENSINYVIGVDSCGNNVCNNGNASYSKFSNIYPAIQNYLDNGLPPDPVGYLESATCNQISGWAADRNRLNAPISVDITDVHGGFIDVYTVLANQPRPDVGNYLGDNGPHGFTFTFPSGLAPGPHTISVSVVGATSTNISNSPRQLNCNIVSTPNVAITSPTSSSTFNTSNSTVTLAGSASGSTGITQVTWANSRGGSGTASGTTSWSTATISLQSGSNIVTVRAQDTNGNIGTDSLSVTFTPVQNDSSPPTIEITIPTTSSTFSTGGSTLTVRGTAWDNIGVTQVTWTNDRGGSGTASGTTNWTANVTSLQSGNNLLTLRARDAAGNTTVDTLTVIYTSPPTCGNGNSINYRVNNGPPIHANGTLIASQNDPGTAFVIVNGQKRGIPTPAILNNLYNQPNGGFQFKEVIKVAQDEFNNYPTGAVVTSALPSNGRSQPDGRLIRKPGGTEIAIVSNGQRRPFASEGAFLGLGYLYCNVVDVADYDSYPAGNPADSITTLRIITIDPNTTQSRDWGGSVIYTYRVFDGNGTPVSGAAVGGGDTLRGIVFIGTLSTDSNGQGTYSTFVPNGTPNALYDVIFVAEKSGYTKSAAVTRQVQVNHFYDTSAPVVALTLPTSSSTYASSSNAITLGGTSSDNVGVTQVSWSNNRGGSGNASGTASWAVNSISLQSGPNVITVSARDAIGNLGTTHITVTYTAPPIDNAGPTLAITSNSDGQEVTTNSVTLVGTASDAGLGDNGVSSVTINGLRANGDTTFGSGTAFWSHAIALNVGSNVLSVVARDTSSNQNATTRIITITLTRTSATSFDFDGDGRADFATWRRNTGDWNILNSSNGSHTSRQWGSGSIFADAIVPGDYDGDGRSDLAVWRPGTGYWYIINSSNNTMTAKSWGHVDFRDIPVPADYDGDGKTDIAVWRSLTGVWYVLRSSDGGFFAQQFGLAAGGDLAVPGDYDGDGRADIAVWRHPSVWYILRSSDQTLLARYWGSGDDDIIPGCDFDGDGIDDLAVWRNSTGVWYVLRSSDSGVTAQQWGGPNLGDIPVAADYDGDGRSDLAVWRMPTGVWYVLNSTNGQMHAQPWGHQDFTDQAVPSAFVRFPL